MIILSICISTYKRPEGLQALLKSIAGQENLDGYLDKIKIAIADNETPPQTHDIATAFSQKTGIEVSWAHEPLQGITFARNTTYRLSEGSTYCFFVDDDQVLDPLCLSEMFRIGKEYNADMIYGNAPPVFAVPDTPEWIKQYFRHSSGTDGENLPYAATNCLLIRRDILYTLEEPFDNRFAHSGGEDTFLTMSLLRKGHKLVKASNARAYDQVPASRCSTAWILRRVVREAALYTTILYQTSSGLKPLLMRLVKLPVKLLAGVIIFIPVTLIPWRYRLLPLMMISDAIGGIMGFFSYRQNAYKS